jgi:DUF1365 family protein
MHRRFRPLPHRLRYRVFWLLLDLDELGTLSRRLKLLRFERAGLASFHSSDHGDGGVSPLRAQIEAQLADAGIELGGGAIKLLCMPRIAGHGFNPLSVYFCYRVDGSLAALVYQVHNTFAQRHSYVSRVSPECDGAITQSVCKTFHVSPFMPMDVRYEFRTVSPDERVSVVIRNVDHAGPLLAAALTGRRRELTDRNIALALLAFPMLTLKVTVAIHWHALRLWWKGVPLVPRPKPPCAPFTIFKADS